MALKAIILDLDNTLFDVRTIGDQVFGPLFELIEKYGHHDKDMEHIKHDVMRIPFQKVAKEYGFRDELTRKATDLLKETVYHGKIEPFPDYQFIKKLPADKYLVTAGFMKLQQSKIDALGVRDDFKEVIVIDASTSSLSKKDVFEEIISKHGYANSEVLITGDDPESEIKAAQELKVNAVLYDKYDQFPDIVNVRKIKEFNELDELFSK
jgi:putative hydrolase of the HAD superfamily